MIDSRIDLEYFQRTSIEAHKYALDWFKIHADQRMRLFNFYILILGGFVVIAGTLFTGGIATLEIISGAALYAISVIFFKLDERISELITVAENGLQATELFFANDIGADAVRVSHYSQKRNGTTSYSKCFVAVFYCGGIIGGAIIWHGLGIFD